MLINNKCFLLNSILSWEKYLFLNYFLFKNINNYIKVDCFTIDISNL